MRHLKILIMALPFLGLLSLPSLSQDWMPLAVGNRWQYIFNFTNYTGSISGTYLTIVTVDSQFYHNARTYFRVNTQAFNYTPPLSYSSPMRYDENTQTLYQKLTNDSDAVLIDFSDSVGYHYMYDGEMRTIIDGNLNLFDSVCYFKGYNFAGIYGNGYTRYVRDIGKCGDYDYFRGMGHEQEGTGRLIQAIIHTDSVHANLYSEDFSLTIRDIFSPRITNFTFHADLVVVHTLLAISSDFTDSVKMYSKYIKDSLVIANPSVPVARIPNSYRYAVSLSLDSLLLLQGYIFNYRFEAKDKSIIQRVAHAPDSGYFSATLDTATKVRPTVNPNSSSLMQNYPNPFNSTTVIDFRVSASGRVSITIFDLLGRKTAVVFDDYASAGFHSTKWSAINLPSGVYFYELWTRDLHERKKLLLLK